MHAICSWHFVHSFIRGHSAGIRPPAGHVFIIFSYITHENDYKIVCSWMLTWLWFSKTTKLYKEPKKTPENHKNKHSNCDPRLLRVVGILIFPLPPTQRALITGSEIALALRLRCRRSMEGDESSEGTVHTGLPPPREICIGFATNEV